MDIVHVFERAVERHGTRRLASDLRREVTYNEAWQEVQAIAARLKEAGVQSGEAVGLCSRDRVELFLSILGTWYIGALPALIDVRTKVEDLPYYLSNIKPRTVVLEAEREQYFRNLTDATLLAIEDIGQGSGSVECEHGPLSHLYLSYTSGTTGRPKGAVLRSSPVTLGTSCIADRLRLERNDILLATTPTASSFQLVAALMPAMHVGASVAFVAGLSTEEIWSVARDLRASILVAYPLTLSDMVNFKEAIEGGSSLRLALSGGSPLAPRLKRDYREGLGIDLIESYGQSELGGFMALGRPGEQYDEGFVGPPLPDRLAYVAEPDGTELAPGEVGEVVVPSGFFDCYWNKPEETKRTLAHGVLHCGDLALSDHDGRLKVLGRLHEAERARERKAFLRELEDAYYEHDAVKHAVVVEDKSLSIRAFVELLEGEDATPEEIASFAEASVSMRADSTVVLDAMPRTFSGKADRLALATSAAATPRPGT